MTDFLNMQSDPVFVIQPDQSVNIISVGIQGPTGAAGTVQSGSVLSGSLATPVVFSGNIASGQVCQFHLASGAVNSGQIASGNYLAGVTLDGLITFSGNPITDIVFSQASGTRQLTIQQPTAPNTAGTLLKMTGASGSTTSGNAAAGAGGQITIQGGFGGGAGFGTNGAQQNARAGAGGAVNIIGGSGGAGTVSGAAGAGGAILIRGGTGGSLASGMIGLSGTGTGVAAQGGNVNIQPGLAAVSGGVNGSITIGTQVGGTIAIGGGSWSGQPTANSPSFISIPSLSIIGANGLTTDNFVSGAAGFVSGFMGSGGLVQIQGGAGGLTFAQGNAGGWGGNLLLQGGVGGGPINANSGLAGPGGNVIIQGGIGGTSNGPQYLIASGGNVFIDGGIANGGVNPSVGYGYNPNGQVYIGTSGTTQVNIGGGVSGQTMGTQLLIGSSGSPIIYNSGRLSTLPNFYIDVPAFQQPIAYYSFNTSVTQDDTGNGHNLTVSGSVPSVAGLIGNAASLDESSQDNVLALANPTPFNFQYNQSFAVSYWIKWTQFANFSSFYYAYPIYLENGWIFSIQGLTGPNLNFAPGGNAPSVICSGFGNVATGNWYFVYGEWNAVTQTITLSVNNVPTSVANVPTWTTTDDGFFIGDGAIAGFDGDKFLMDEVSIWNRVLTSAEQTTLYNAGAGHTITDATFQSAFKGSINVGTLHGENINIGASGSTTVISGTLVLPSGAIQSGNIASGSVGQFALASGAVNSGHIASGSFFKGHLASGTISDGILTWSGGQQIVGQSGLLNLGNNAGRAQVNAHGEVILFDGSQTYLQLGISAFGTGIPDIFPTQAGGSLGLLGAAGSAGQGGSIVLSPGVGSSGYIDGLVYIQDPSGNASDTTTLAQLSGGILVINSWGGVSPGSAQRTGYVFQAMSGTILSMYASGGGILTVGNSGNVVIGSRSGGLDGLVESASGALYITAASGVIIQGTTFTLTSGDVQSGNIGNSAVTSGNIASGAIGQFALSSGAVVSGDIGNAAVVSGSIASGSISQFHHSSGAVVSGHIGNAAVVSGSYASGSISTFAINAGGVLSGNIASGQVGFGHLANGAVQSGTVASGSLSPLHTQSGFVVAGAGISVTQNAGNFTVANSSGGFTLTSGIITSGMIANNAVVSGSVASGQLGQMHLSSGAVNSGQIGNNAVVSGSIASGQISQFHHASGSVVSGQIGNAAVVSGSIASGAVGQMHLSSGAVVSGDIGNNAVISGSYASGSISTFAVNAGGILSGNVASGQIGFGHLANASVQSGTIASGQVGQFHHSSGAVVSGQIGNAAVVSGSIASGAVGQFHLSSGAVVSGDIGNNAVVSGSYASGSIFQFHVANAGITSGNIASGAVSTNHIASGTTVTAANTEQDTSMFAVETISGGMAVCIMSGGYIGQASPLSGTTRMPAIGFVATNVASGAAVTIIQGGRINLGAGQAFLWSGSYGVPLFVGSSGANTSGCFLTPKAGATACINQRIGYALSGGLFVSVGVMTSGQFGFVSGGIG